MVFDLQWVARSCLCTGYALAVLSVLASSSILYGSLYSAHSFSSTDGGDFPQDHLNTKTNSHSAFWGRDLDLVKWFKCYCLIAALTLFLISSLYLSSFILSGPKQPRFWDMWLDGNMSQSARSKARLGTQMAALKKTPQPQIKAHGQPHCSHPALTWAALVGAAQMCLWFWSFNFL